MDGLRQAEAAERLGVSRATVSVIADRGRIRHLQGLAAGLWTIFRDGVTRADALIGDASDEARRRGGERRVTDTVLVIAWLVLAHLVADFVLQNDWIAINKGAGSRTGWAALGTHGFHVGLCLVPAIFAFGMPGIVYVALVVVTHMLVDRWKVRATRRAERSAQEAARTRLAATGDAPDSGLGSAWTPWPGMLFVADQVLHLTIAIVAWLVVLEGVPLQQGFVDVVNTILRDWDRATVHAVVLTGVVLVSLFLVNTRAAYYFVLALVSPRWVPAEPAARAPETATAPSAMPAPAPSGYTVRVGPLVATVEPGVAAVTPAPSAESAETTPSTAPTATSETTPSTAPTAAAQAASAQRASAGSPSPEPSAHPRSSVPTGAPARIGATIGALERLLIVVFVLVGAEAAVGFVIAAKTIARFKQLDDRGFAEYYLLGTLASVSVALASAIIAKAALGTLQ